MIALLIVIGLTAAVLLLPTVSDALSLGKLLFRRRGSASSSTGPLPRLLFLIPAHDEEMLIGTTIASFQKLDYPADHYDILVVADNCSDRTAEIVRSKGVWCLERVDRDRRGKPWAIAWALERIPLDDYDGVVILDADAVVDAGFGRALAGVAPLNEKVVQCYNDVSNPEENALTRMAGVFSAVRCVYMNGLKRRCGLNVPLGNGLCIGSGVLRRHGWEAFSICEDWELYALLTARGISIDHAPAARVLAQEARSLRQSSSQRRRWTAGKLTVLGRYAVRLLASRNIGPHQKLDALAELAAPGPVVHLGLVVLLMPVAYAFGGVWASVLGVCLVAPVARLLLLTVAAIGRSPDPWRSVAAFWYLPVYAVWRLAIQAAALRMVGSKPWVRTRRHLGPDVEPAA